MVNPRGLAAFDALSSHIAILDSAGSIIYVNASWRVFAAENGGTDAHRMCGANYLDVCRRAAAAGDISAEQALKGINRVISGEIERYRQRYPCHGAGAERWFMMTVTRAGSGRDIVISHDDITALVRAEREKEAAERGLAHGLGAKVFVANLEHELRTPLNAILGFSEVIRDQLFGDDPKRYSNYAGDIYKSGERLLDVIRDILKIASINAGKYQLREVSLRLDKHLQDWAGAVRTEAQNRRVELSAVAVEPGVSFVGDETALRDIVVHLLYNAIKFTPKGGKVSFSAKRSPNGRLRLVISDTGPGMSAKEIQDAMEPFRQVGKGADETEGAGLGLPLARLLAELHGGTLEIQSTPGLGTTISVEFPAWRVGAPRPVREHRKPKWPRQIAGR